MFLICVLQNAEKKGIHFEDTLSWSRIKAKAKIEHKYIFVDCFTTWCGPCRLMEKEIYSQERIGNYFNTHFICIKLQMNKTDSDNIQVRNWYTDAHSIDDRYGVPAYPTYLFFSPDGQLVNRGVGYKDADDLLMTARKAIATETLIPYQHYYSLANEYEQGHRDYNIMPSLIDTSWLLGRTEIAENVGSPGTELEFAL